MIAADMDLAARLLHPAVQALLLALLSSALVLWRRPRAALAVGVFAFAWIWMASTPLLALRLREGLATVGPATYPRADAIVVLGGGKLPVGDWSRTTTRAGMGLSLWREGLATRVLVSGSDQAIDLAQGFGASGVPRRDLLIEGLSRNTHENAHNAASLLKAEGLDEVLLVTSAIHMRRAAGAFRHEGIAVSPAPSNDGHARLATEPAWVPRRDALTLTARCLHEYVALWVYHRRGWI
jgi:uncharacterized SAM-binding protein YcdF (DUF218 family)